MSGAVKSGWPTALDAARPQDQAVADEPEQLDLLGLPARRDRVDVPDGARGPGRPPGARNRRTEALATYLLARYAHPLEMLMQIASSPVEGLVARLGCTPLEAFQEKRHAALAALPYLAQRQAVAVDVNNRSVVHLSIHDGAPAAADVVLAQIVDVVENQHLTDGGNDEV